jgi:hypothetical protein
MTLPEELLHEIFKWAFYLHVDNRFLVFCDKQYRTEHPILHYELCKPPPTQLLLVCKKWYGVGRPSFYSIVTLHNDVQLKLLARTLNSTPSCRPMIRHLRLDGCFDRPLHTIAKLTPNIHVLSLQLFMSHKKKGNLQKALSLWNITDLFLHHKAPRGNLWSTELSRVIARAMKKWMHKSLVSANVYWYFFTMPVLIKVDLGTETGCYDWRIPDVPQLVRNIGCCRLFCLCYLSV